MSLNVEIWSDVVCPWCYIGKRRFEAALARFEHRDDGELVWRSFELDGSAPPSSDEQGSYAERLASKYGCSPAQAQAMIDTITATAAVEGLDFRFDLARPGNTFDAHRLLHLALEHGLSGVPVFVIDGRYGISGAQPADAVLATLDKAWSELPPLTLVALQDSAPSCEGDSCAI